MLYLGSEVGVDVLERLHALPAHEPSEVDPTSTAMRPGTPRPQGSILQRYRSDELVMTDPLLVLPDLAVGVVTDSATVDVVCRERQLAYGSDGPGNFGRTPYDDYSEHLVATSAADERPLGSIRLGFGPRLLEHGGFPAFELSRYWKANQAPDDFLYSALEITRVWITRDRVPEYRSILRALWIGLQGYLGLHSHLDHIIGAVALVDYPPDAAERVVTHFVRFHPASQTIFSPINPAPAGSVEWHGDADGMLELEGLNTELRSRDPRKGVPPLLYLYASVGMNVLADPGYDETGRGVLIPVQVSAHNLTDSFEAMRRGLQVTR